MRVRNYCKISVYLAVVSIISLRCSDTTITADNKVGERAISPIKRSANVKIHEINNQQTSQQWWQSYATGYTVIAGQDFFDSDQLTLEVVKTKNAVNLRVLVDLTTLGEPPTVYNRSFRKDEPADQLQFTMVLKDHKKRTIAKLESKSKSDSKNATAFTLTPKEYNLFKAGLTNMNITIDTEYISFFGVKSGVHPVTVEIETPFQLPKIYRTTLYFKSLKLNEEQTKALLGDNDWNNPAPEVGIHISIDQMTVLDEFEKNSFELKGPFKSDIFHCSKTDLLNIKIQDVDYGFNGSDLINDTLIPIKNLEGKDYMRLKMNYVDELWMYAEFKGEVN